MTKDLVTHVTPKLNRNEVGSSVRQHGTLATKGDATHGTLKSLVARVGLRVPTELARVAKGAVTRATDERFLGVVDVSVGDQSLKIAELLLARVARD